MNSLGAPLYSSHLPPSGRQFLSLNWALFRMGALSATTLAIDEFLNDLALGGTPVGDNLPAALGTNSYFVGAWFEHEGRRGEGRAQEERELATIAFHFMAVTSWMTWLGTSTPMKITMAVELPLLNPPPHVRACRLPRPRAWSAARKRCIASASDLLAQAGKPGE